MWITIGGLLGLHELRLRCGFRIPRLDGLRHISCAVSRTTYDPHSGRARPKQGRKAKREMEKARAILSVGEEESERVAGLDVRPHRAGYAASFYEGFATRGLRVDCVRPGFVSCTFKVPPRLTVSPLAADGLVIRFTPRFVDYRCSSFPRFGCTRLFAGCWRESVAGSHREPGG